jgi:hypothetical protein
MATRTAYAVAQEKAAETKRRSRQRPAVEVRHVQPVRPSRESFPAGVEGTRRYREAETAYEAALLAYAAEVGAPVEDGDLAALEQFFAKGQGSGVAVVPIPVNATPEQIAEAAQDVTGKGGNVAPVEEKPRRRTRSAANTKVVREAEKKTPAKRRPPVVREDEATAAGQVEERRPAKRQPKAKEQPAKSTAKAPSVPVPDGFKSWTDAKLATAVVRMKTKENKTIKAIAEELGLPAVHRSWFLVSKVWRDTADSKGIDRPRLSEEAIAARKAKRDS